MVCHISFLKFSTGSSILAFPKEKDLQHKKASYSVCILHLKSPEPVHIFFPYFNIMFLKNINKQVTEVYLIKHTHYIFNNENKAHIFW